MPRPPSPKTFSCPTCGWMKTVIPRSDALVMGRDWLCQCQDCGQDQLESRDASTTEVLKARLLQTLAVLGR